MLKPVAGTPSCFLLVLFSLVCTTSAASHLISVEIRAKPVDCNTRTYEIIVIAYLSSTSVATFGGDQDVLSFGDGQQHLITEQSSTVIDAERKIARVEYHTFHTYSAYGNYVLSYLEPNRNEFIVNMESSSATTYYTETSITISPNNCDASPYFNVPPVDRACSGIAYYHNAGAVDLDDDSLSFSLIVPKKQKATDVVKYGYPHNVDFYTSAGINYNQGNENHNGPPTFNIDAIDGTLTWDAPGAAGEYAIAVKVTSWKFNPADSSWVESGFSIRDMQVVVSECDNTKPDLTVPSDLCITAGTLVQFTVPGTDPDGHPVIIEAFSGVFSLSDGPAEVRPSTAVPQSTAAPYDTAALRFKWNTNCLHVKNQPYNIVFKITDSPPTGPRLVRFKTVAIKVIAPAPEIEAVTVNPLTKKVTLEWKDYPCENVKTIQVWRRVAKYDYDQPACNTGMPYFLRYTLISTLPGDATTYTDSDLSIGALYCYRIVALVGESRITSRISLDTCFIPKPAEAPVITNVSVVDTDESLGRAQVRWTSPFNIDKNQYPPPYKYKVYRSEETDNSDFVELTPSAITDTVFIDSEINTVLTQYYYKIQLFVPGLSEAPIDTSSTASSVYLKAESQPNAIKLTWQANTPWYNYVQAYPFHRIYRSDVSPSGPFTLIDSVDVNDFDFQYTDVGTFESRPLVEGQLYYYKVLTRGAYGNPAINEPLQNLSQVVKGFTLDVTPPCTPVVVIEAADCSTFECTTDAYYNRLSWDYPAGCLPETLNYTIFVDEAEDQEFVPLATTSGNSFQHTNLTSLAKCYKIAAVDAAGNMSPLSQPACNDNCPYIELPNVFTPGADGRNDNFEAYGPDNGPDRCARFVKQIDFKIFNRWGMEIYSVNHDSFNDVYRFWNGFTNSGKETDSGVYYYSANVTFDVRDPSKQNKVIKGWVHLVRGD
jgi:hypothetical protein